MDVVMTASMVGDVPAAGDAMQSGGITVSGTTSDDTWVILQTTSMGLCICTYYCSLNVHLGAYYIHDVQHTSHTPVQHSVSIKVI